MPFGLKNAAQSFQRFMDVVCRGLDFVFVYLDNILIASSSKGEHHSHLRQLFERLHRNGLIIHLAKSKFGCSELDFLGHHVSRHGVLPMIELQSDCHHRLRKAYIDQGTSRVRGHGEFLSPVRATSGCQLAAAIPGACRST